MYTNIKKSISTRYTTWFYKKRHEKETLIVLFFIDLSHFPLSSATVFFARKLRNKPDGVAEGGGVSNDLITKLFPLSKEIYRLSSRRLAFNPFRRYTDYI